MICRLLTIIRDVIRVSGALRAHATAPKCDNSGTGRAGGGR